MISDELFNELKTRYPYVYAFSRMIHPDSEYMQKSYLEEAYLNNCPKDGVFKIRSAPWTTFSDITNRYTREYLIKLLKADGVSL